MAPVYALMISFVIVLLVGFAVHRSQPGEAISNTPAASGQSVKKIQFRASGTNVSLAKLSGTKVELFSEVHRTATMDQSGKLSEPDPDKPFTICLDLPPGWSAKNAQKPDESRYTCWGPFNPGDDATLTLSMSPVGTGRR
jgi:hypothetical protein